MFLRHLQHFSSQTNFFANENVVIKISGLHFKAPRRSRAPSHEYSGSLKVLKSNQLFLLLVLKAPGHSKNSRNSGIPTGVGLFLRPDLGFSVPSWSLRMRPKHLLIHKVISGNLQ